LSSRSLARKFKTSRSYINRTLAPLVDWFGPLFVDEQKAESFERNALDMGKHTARNRRRRERRKLKKKNGEAKPRNERRAQTLNQVFGKAQRNRMSVPSSQGRGRRNGGGGKQGVAVAYPLDSMRAFLRFQSTPNGDCRVQGRDYLTILKTPELASDWDVGAIGQLMYSLPLAPQSIPAPRSRLLASMYQKYQILSVTIHYVAGSPTTDAGSGVGPTGAGSILGAFINDPADVNIGDGQSALQILRSTTNSNSTNVWRNKTWHFTKRDDTVYYIDPSTPSSDDAAVRQEQQALFLLYNELAIPSLGASLGTLWITYDYLLKDPIVNERDVLGAEMMLVYDQNNLPASMTATTMVDPNYIVETNGSSLSPTYCNIVNSNTITGFDLTAMGLQKDDYVAFVARAETVFAWTTSSTTAIYVDNLNQVPVGTGNTTINDWPYTGTGGADSWTNTSANKYTVWNGMYQCTSDTGCHLALRPDNSFVAAWNGAPGCRLSIYMKFFKGSNPWNFVSSLSVFAKKKHISMNDMIGLDQRLKTFEKKIEELLALQKKGKTEEEDSQDSSVNSNKTNNNNDIDEYLERMRDAGRGLRTDAIIVPDSKYTSPALGVPITSIPEKRSGSPNRKC